MNPAEETNGTDFDPTASELTLVCADTPAPAECGPMGGVVDASAPRSIGDARAASEEYRLCPRLRREP